MAAAPRLGTLEASEQLLQDLYVSLRQKLRRWAAVTKQTPQARMGYVGQHLVSVVTGYPGGRSGARGKDLILSSTEYAEIKTCYRVDQLGKCLDCGAAVASVEEVCPNCGSSAIQRPEDSKWLIGIRNEDEFRSLLRPKDYFLALFEFAAPQRIDTIQASIWTVDPHSPGFALCMVDYYYNIQAKSKSRAPFNLWPYLPKFDFMRPNLIYRSHIRSDDTVSTLIFPGREPPVPNPLKPLAEYDRSRNLSNDSIATLASMFGVDSVPTPATKKALLTAIQKQVTDRQVTRDDLADAIARSMYSNRVRPHLARIPPELKTEVERMLINQVGS